MQGLNNGVMAGYTTLLDYRICHWDELEIVCCLTTTTLSIRDALGYDLRPANVNDRITIVALVFCLSMTKGGYAPKATTAEPTASLRSV